MCNTTPIVSLFYLASLIFFEFVIMLQPPGPFSTKFLLSSINSMFRIDWVALAQVEVPGRKFICPGCPRQNMSMSRPRQTERTYVQTIVRSFVFPDHVVLNARHPPPPPLVRSFRSGHIDFWSGTSAWVRSTALPNEVEHWYSSLFNSTKRILIHEQRALKWEICPHKGTTVLICNYTMSLNFHKSAQ